MPDPRYNVVALKDVEKDLKQLDPPLRKQALAWMENVLPFTPMQKASQMKYLKVPTFRCKPTDRLRILFQIYDDTIYVMAVSLRGDDTYDKQTVTNRQSRVEQKRAEKTADDSDN